MRSEIMVVLVLLLPACNNREAVQCVGDANCDLAGGGTCVVAPSGHHWCAYPDPDCSSGSRYSNLDGDGLAGQCVTGSSQDAGVDAPATHDAAPDAMLTWSAPELLAGVNSTADERYPAPSADDLELYFARLSSNPPYGDIYIARRTSTDQQFGTPTAVSEVNGSNTNEIFAVPSHTDLELFVSEAGIVMAYTRSNKASQWGAPVSTGINALNISLSPDDLTMNIIARCPADVDSGTGPCFFYSTRPSIGGVWSAPTYLGWDGTTQWYSGDVSADGLHALVSGSFSGSGIPIGIETRTATTAAWSHTDVLSPLDLEATNENARWNPTGTEIYLDAEPAGMQSTLHDIYISVLQ